MGPVATTFNTTTGPAMTRRGARDARCTRSTISEPGPRPQSSITSVSGSSEIFRTLKDLKFGAEKVCADFHAFFLRYSIFGANCQYFSIRVLHQLVLEGHISQNDFDAVASMAVFNESLLAKWSNIRSTPSLPPL